MKLLPKVYKVMFGFVVLLSITAGVLAGEYPKGAKWAYIDRCTESLSANGLHVSRARPYCTCITDGMEKEFGMKEYDQMMRAQPNPRGDEYDRRLYMVFTSCKNHLPK